jgi:hypothetical protein
MSVSMDMDDFSSDHGYRGLGRTTEGWAAAPSVGASAPSRVSDLLLLASLAAFLFDTFAPWQRVCVSLSTPFGTLGGCFLSANAWTGSGGGLGVGAGICAILGASALVLGRARLLGPGAARLQERVFVYATVATGAGKWLVVVTKAVSVAAYGAWLGLALLFVIAAVETIRTQA